MSESRLSETKYVPRGRRNAQTPFRPELWQTCRRTPNAQAAHQVVEYYLAARLTSQSTGMIQPSINWLLSGACLNALQFVFDANPNGSRGLGRLRQRVNSLFFFSASSSRVETDQSMAHITEATHLARGLVHSLEREYGNS